MAKTTVRASTGVELVIWQHEETFHARRADSAAEPQVCLAVDLFEVVAELAGLDLEHSERAAEAVALAADARRRLKEPAAHPGIVGDQQTDLRRRRRNG